MKPDFSKYNDGLVPAIIQDDTTGKVLMLGFMNAPAFNKTLLEKKVTFFSRSRQCLWTKGETSGHFLLVREIVTDCDDDTILIKATASGPVCHTGAATCFNERNPAFSLRLLEETISDRKKNPSNSSYTSQLFKKGINKIAQKLGEEAVELVIESKDNNKGLFLGEAADLLYHYLVLLQAKNCSLEEVISVLENRRK